MINGEFDVQVPHPSLPRSFSAPHPPLEGIMEEGSAGDSWQWDFRGADPAWLQEAAEDHLTEEDYQQALRVEGYILSLVQRHTLSPRPCQPRTTLNPDPPHGSVSGHRRTPSQTAEQRLPDPHHQPYVDLLTTSKSHAWGCDPPEVGACRGEAQLFEKDCYLALPYPQSRPHSLTGRLPSPLPSMDPNGSVGPPDLFCDPPSPQHYLYPLPPVPQMHNLVSAQYISGQSSQAPVRSPRHYKSEQPKPSRAAASPDHPSSKYKASKKGHSDRQRSKKTNSKTGRSQSENSLLGQRGLPERRYSTTERRQDKTNPSPSKAPAAGPQVSNNGRNGSRRWCSNLELSQDEAETQTSHKRPPRRIRHGHPCSHAQQQHAQRWHQDCQVQAPLGPGGEAYAAAAAPPAESESSTSEVYTPASSSLSSDSDESGGLVWPQQLPPRLASTSSSSSPSPQAAASASSHPKAFVKIKASHALKKKILRFRSGSLKVMTTV